MKHNYFYLFFVMLFLYGTTYLAAMEEIAGRRIPGADVERLRPWDIKNVKRGTIVAFKSGDYYSYGILHKKEAEGFYSIIVACSTTENKVQTTRGLIVGSEALRLLPLDS